MDMFKFQGSSNAHNVINILNLDRGEKKNSNHWIGSFSNGGSSISPRWGRQHTILPKFPI